MKKGFTLMEVCLVMLVFAIAISTILAFFPVALRQGNSAVTDSVVTSFADYVLNSLQANAAKMEWEKWEKHYGDDGFCATITDGITLEADGDPKLKYDAEQTLKNYLGVEDSTIKYKLDLPKPDQSPRAKQITLYVTDNKYADVTKGHTFVSHVIYLGKVPE